MSIPRVEDFNTKEFQSIRAALGETEYMHRKVWEFVSIAKSVGAEGGLRALGFGVGKEPLASYFASLPQTSKVLATDYPDRRREWAENGQWSESVDDLHRPAIVSLDRFTQVVEHAPVDMNHIPPYLLSGMFDFTWSAGSLEHLGGKERGIQFFLRQMACLRPGGIAAHTTELDMSPDGAPPCDSPDLCAYTPADLQSLADRLRAQGDYLLPLDLSSGTSPEDLYVDTEPYEQGPAHLKLKLGQWTITSVLLIAVRGGAKRDEVEEGGEVGDVNDADKTGDAKDTAALFAPASPLRPPTILWIGDAVVSSGFAKCTHQVCSYLHTAGWDVHVLGVNYYGDPHPYPYPIYPCRQPWDGGTDPYGVGRLPRMIERIKPDVVVFLTDPWHIKTYVREIQHSLPSYPPLVAWLAVDGLNQPGEDLNDLTSVIVWTEFGKRELERAGCKVPISIIPLGVDLSLYYPRDRTESRAVFCPPPVPAKPFIVGMVGRNQLRKRLDLAIESFSRWVNNPTDPITDALLYLYIGPTGDTGYDLHRLIRYYNVSGLVTISNTDIGYGLHESMMPSLYSCFDVFLSTSIAEGWCLPALEAMACGVPCVVGDAGGLASWASSSAYMAWGDTSQIIGPLNSFAYTVGSVPTVSDLAAALDDIYRNRDMRLVLASEGNLLAQSLSWENAGKSMSQHLDHIASCHREGIPFFHERAEERRGV
jgi:D-inositol-3-phosphate glycosyltransferase